MLKYQFKHYSDCQFVDSSELIKVVVTIGVVS